MCLSMTGKLTSTESTTTVAYCLQDHEPTITLRLKSKTDGSKASAVAQKIEAIAEEALQHASSEEMQLKIFVWQEDILAASAAIEDEPSAIHLAHLLCFGMCDLTLTDELQAEIMDILSAILPDRYSPALFVHEFKINFSAVVINARVDNAASRVVDMANTALYGMGERFDKTRRGIRSASDQAEISAGQAVKKIEKVAQDVTHAGFGLSKVLKRMAQDK